LIFCDTSALAECYVPEAESAALASRLDSEDAVVVSELVTALQKGSKKSARSIASSKRRCEHSA
jgi:hypothetical protein